jgi:hypothetical protein
VSFSRFHFLQNFRRYNPEKRHVMPKYKRNMEEYKGDKKEVWNPTSHFMRKIETQNFFKCHIILLLFDVGTVRFSRKYNLSKRHEMPKCRLGGLSVCLSACMSVLFSLISRPFSQTHPFSTRGTMYSYLFFFLTSFQEPSFSFITATID